MGFTQIEQRLTTDIGLAISEQTTLRTQIQTSETQYSTNTTQIAMLERMKAELELDVSIQADAAKSALAVKYGDKINVLKADNDALVATNKTRYQNLEDAIKKEKDLRESLVNARNAFARGSISN
ncbi:hypothetical protein [Peribacillus frigoritolerans]|uniref:Uncharacterized protein n=1 Tax=Peribacillus castrilensis TaxID=2897690 RepID=A0AAW9NBF2_9BACI|nr:hypothetical protein [Peribacillus castrilensis]